MITRAYQKGELASLYYPWCSQRQALRHFARDLEYSTDLNSRLRAIGWRPTHRLFNPQQVMLIFEHFGEPGD